MLYPYYIAFLLYVFTRSLHQPQKCCMMANTTQEASTATPIVIAEDSWNTNPPLNTKVSITITKNASNTNEYAIVQYLQVTFSISLGQIGLIILQTTPKATARSTRCNVVSVYCGSAKQYASIKIYINISVMYPVTRK